MKNEFGDLLGVSFDMKIGMVFGLFQCDGVFAAV